MKLPENIYKNGKKYIGRFMVQGRNIKIGPYETIEETRTKLKEAQQPFIEEGLYKNYTRNINNEE